MSSVTNAASSAGLFRPTAMFRSGGYKAFKTAPATATLDAADVQSMLVNRTVQPIVNDILSTGRSAGPTPGPVAVPQTVGSMVDVTQK